MKIAQVVAASDGTEPEPRDIERLVGYLTAQLVNDGHEVTLFAGSTGTQLRVASGKSRHVLSALPDVVESVLASSHRFDVVHLHGDLRRYAPFGELTTPLVATMHSYPSAGLLAARVMLPQMALVAVSDHQRELIKGFRWHATIPHGLPERLHTCTTDPKNYLAYVGSLASISSVKRAAEIALRSGMLLKVADRLVGRELRHLGQQLAPLVKRGVCIEFAGELNAAALGQLLGQASALLHTNEWSEPMPLAVLDALACGTPVIAWRSGGLQQLIEHGQTGFLVSSVEEAERAVASLGKLSRLACRRAFDERFEVRRMAHSYTALYEAILRTSVPDVTRYAALRGRDGAL